MIESSVAYSAPTNTVVDRIEREIARLKAARPHLRSRIERAEHILVTQLSTANGTHRPMKVRVHADGSRSFTVRSCSKLRKVYSVEAGSFRCDCPDARRRHAACKHGIAAYVLERALPTGDTRRPSDPTGANIKVKAPEGALPGPGCAGCSEAKPGVELFEVLDSLTFFAGDLVCRDCADSTASETV
ncbi:MAG: hypothetical protein ACRDSJ_03040 [Rubrobacteraceae bacterium]